MSQNVKRRRSARLSGSGHYNKRSKASCPVPTNFLSLEDFQEMATFISDKIDVSPQVGIVCGSGLGALADLVEQPTLIPYNEVPNMPVSTVEGHEGMFVVGTLGGRAVICMKGRVHHYEGYHPQQVTAAVRVMSLLGIQFLVLTNAAGGVNKNFKAGDLMLIEDHINLLGLTGRNPLVGPNLDSFLPGDRFTSMVNAYDKELRELALSLAPKHQLQLQQGVYVYLGGPSFETPAELRFLSMIGGDAVGMSTAPEVIVARHCDIKTIAISHISNMCVLPDDSQPNDTSHQDVLSMGEESCKKMTGFIVELISSFKFPVKDSGEELMGNTQDGEVFPGAKKVETGPSSKEDKSIDPLSKRSPNPTGNGSNEEDRQSDSA